MRYPLANDVHGNPIEVPANAVAWRVRRGGGRRGRPRNVYDAETGKQLEVPLEATLEELADRGCPAGRYRLEAIDADGRVIPNVVAMTEVPEEAATDEDDGEGKAEGGNATLDKALALVGQLVDTNCRAMEAMAGAFGTVRPAHGAPEPVIIAQPQQAPMRPEQLMQTVGQVVQTAKSVFDTWKAANGTPGGAA
jgi:hypothetical protein